MLGAIGRTTVAGGKLGGPKQKLPDTWSGHIQRPGELWSTLKLEMRFIGKV